MRTLLYFAIVHHFGKANDGVEWCSEFMRHIGKEFVLEAIGLLDTARLFLKFHVFALELLLQHLLLGHITDGSDGMEHPIEQQSPQTDVHRKFCAILPPPGEVKPGSHLTSDGGSEIVLAMLDMGLSEALRQEEF